MASVTVTPTPDEIAQVLGYREGRWHHHVNYECIHCQYSTIFLEKMKKHQEEDFHVWSFPSGSPHSGVNDAEELTY